MKYSQLNEFLDNLYGSDTDKLLAMIDRTNTRLLTEELQRVRSPKFILILK